MSEHGTTPGDDREPLASKAITDRLEDLAVGDEISVNNRDVLYEVVETDRYSVTVADPDGNHFTISQNLQRGGWAIHEEVWWVDTGDSTG